MFGYDKAEELAAVFNGGKAMTYPDDVLKAGREAAPKWRTDIENAPNKTDVLLYQDGWAINPIIVGRRDGDTWLSDCFDIDSEHQRPTHWLPLPDAPEVG